MSGVFDDQPQTAQPDQEPSKTPSYEELLSRLQHKDQFIAQLQGETAGLREELGKRVGAEDLFRQIVESKPEPAPEVDTSPKDNKPVGEPNLEVDLAQKIRDEIQAADREKVGRNNAEQVANRLVEAYGTEEKANEVVRAKAAELGVSVQWLLDIAVQSPKAFFNTTGLETQSRPPAQAPRTEVNPLALKATDNSEKGYGTKEYFDNIRRENPAKYWDPSVQNAIFKAAQAGTYKA